MAQSGTPSPIRVFQKRLTMVLAVFGLLGCFVLGILWWDSIKYITSYRSSGKGIAIYSGVVVLESVPVNGLYEGYLRAPAELFDLDSPYHPLILKPTFRSDFIRIPIYLLILTYLSTLLLIWIVLMNRLARRHFNNTTSIPSQD